MAYVNVAEWSPEHVADWLRGLDDEIQPYTQFFINNSINGCHLLTLCRDDLANLNISKIGHQELVLEAVELLKQLHYNLTSETLQSSALKLGCKAQSLYNHLKRICQDFTDDGKKERVSTETLLDVSEILNLVKALISWLDRYPFAGQEKYVTVRKAVLKLSVELASTAQRDQFAETPHKVIKEICLNLASQSDKIVQDFNDSLIIQPAVLEVARIKRKADDDVGVHINSSYTGVHIIESVKFQSPAYRCGKVEDGDEVVQVNYQTVVGWQVRNIIHAIKEHPSEVHLTLKKRPRHPNVLGQVITLWPYRIPSKKTAFRKLYKWNKGKTTVDIRDVCPKSLDPRCDINSMTENINIPANDRERQLLFGRSRSRIRRRATVTGISPTALQPPVNLEDLISGNMKKKHSVGRTVSYDPGKVVNDDDSVFKDDIPNLEFSKASDQGTGNGSTNGTDKKEQKNQFLKPPTDKYLGSCLKRQQQVVEISPQSEISDIKLLVDFKQADDKSDPPAVTSSEVNKNVPVKPWTKPESGHEDLKQKLADWVLNQKKRHEGVVNGNSGPAEPPPSPKSGLLSQGESLVQSVRKNGNNALHFSLKESRPSLSEIRKKAANARLPPDRPEPHGRKNIPLPRQHVLNKRQNVPQNLGGNSVKLGKVKENELNSHPSYNMYNNKKPILSVPRKYKNLDGSNCAMIPQFPYEMHESKIVSLKPKAHINKFMNPQNKLIYVSKQTARNGSSRGLTLQNGSIPNSCAPQSRTMTKKHSQTTNKGPHLSNFNTLYGRSLSYNDIAFSSGSSSSEEKEANDDDEDEEGNRFDEVYKSHQGSVINQKTLPTDARSCMPEMNPNFAAKFAEVCYMLNQGHSFPKLPSNASTNKIDPASSVIIDELAKRMYQALQQDHIQSQRLQSACRSGTYAQPTVTQRAKYSPANLRNSSSDKIYGNFNPEVHKNCPLPTQYTSNVYPYHIAKRESSDRNAEYLPSTVSQSKRLSPNSNFSTSHELHNFYTQSNTFHSNQRNSYQRYENDKQKCSTTIAHNGYSEKNSIYGSIPFHQDNKPQYGSYQPNEVNSQTRHYSQTISRFCPAEKESEGVQCNDKVISTPSDGWKYFDKGVFYPIKEDRLREEQGCDEGLPSCDVTTSEKNSSSDSGIHGSHRSSCADMNSYSQDENEADLYSPDGKNSSIESSKNREDSAEMFKFSHKDVPLSIASLMSHMPKPPEQEYSSTETRCSAAQTDSETRTSHIQDTNCVDSTLNTEISDSSVNLGYDESFVTAENTTHNSGTENANDSSSSLSSSASSSTISSASSCYYYVETRFRPQANLPMEPLNNGNETYLTDGVRSPTLPTMGISMLSKKRSPTSGGSDSGCNSEPLQHSNEDIPAACEQQRDVFKTSSIITDSIHFSLLV